MGDLAEFLSGFTDVVSFKCDIASIECDDFLLSINKCESLRSYCLNQLELSILRFDAKLQLEYLSMPSPVQEPSCLIMVSSNQGYLQIIFLTFIFVSIEHNSDM